MSQKRKLEDPNEAFCQTPPKKSRTQYSLDFKLNVLDNAKSFSSNRTLASHFHIDEKQIRQWKKDESNLRSYFFYGKSRNFFWFGLTKKSLKIGKNLRVF